MRGRRAARARPSGRSSGRLHAVGARTLLARLDLERDALATVERVEVQAAVEACAMEEVLPSVLRGDEPEAPVLDELLDGACRHRRTPPSRFTVRWYARALIEKERTTAANIARP